METCEEIVADAPMNREKRAKDAAYEIRETWDAARKAGSDMEAFRILERMVFRLGYGRIANNPSLVQEVEDD